MAFGSGVNDPKNTSPLEPANRYAPFLFMIAFIVVLNFVLVGRGEPVENIPYSRFLTLIEENKIADVTISETSIGGRLKDPAAGSPERFATVPVKDDGLVQRLYDRKIPFKSELTSPFWTIFFSWVIPFLILYAVWSFVFRRMAKGQSGMFSSLTKSRAKVFVETDVKTTFADVAGVDEAKAELRETIDFLKDPKKFSRLGGHAPKGLLLVGPPGTGKTLLARAVAGEAGVPFFSINGSEFVEMFVGLGAARVRDLFAQARERAPCILFIDEIDALGKSRAMGLGMPGGNNEQEQTLNQLLAEMDGFDSTEGVIMLASTNRPEVLDPALMRAGRFDRQILLGNPDQASRLEILRVHSRKIKLSPATDLARVASFTSGFSGADLANLVNEAALVATRRDGEDVTEDDFSHAVERIVAGLEKKTKVLNADEKRRIAYHELGHATAALALKCQDKVHKISVIPRGMGALGYTLQRPTEDRYLLDEEEMLSKICVLLGGRASEKLHCGLISTGASDDLIKATDLARAMITQYGMSQKLGLANLDGRRSSYLQSAFEPGTGVALSEHTAAEVDREIKNILDRGFAKALQCLRENQKFIEEATTRLLENETLNEKEIAELWQKWGRASSGPVLTPSLNLL